MQATSPLSTVFDCIVVGAGGAHGSAAIYHLAKRGAQVLGLEAQPAAPHDLGSSHGLSRIIRLAYHEHASYVPLLQDSYSLWRALEEESGDQLLTMTGCVSAAASDQACSPDASCVHGALLAARQHGLAHEVLSGQQASQRFPAYQLPAHFVALHEPEGGLLVPERCIAAHLRLAQRHGAQLRCSARVLGWRVRPPAPGGGGQGLLEVQTEGGTFTARRLVLAAGGWMPQLVPELEPILTVERQVVGWFAVAPDQRRHFTPQAFPVFLLQDDMGYYYGFPADELGFKIGKYHHLRQATTADDVDRGVSAADEEALRQCVRRYFPGANGELTHAAVCTFTNTPDHHFILDRHPRHSQVVLASACSGHGFKFASVVGRILADLSLLGATPLDISLHRLDPSRPGQAAVLEALGRATGPAVCQ